MEIKIPKEVRQHKETIFFGLSARQFFCAVIAVGLAVGVYLGLGPVIGKETASWVCILAAAPVAPRGLFQLQRHGRWNSSPGPLSSLNSFAPVSAVLFPRTFTMN